MRNEVGAVASTKKITPIYIENKRQQRNSLMLKDVSYRLWAKLIFIPQGQRDTQTDNKEQQRIRMDENPQKYYSMFERRAGKGQCFNQPYLGTRECAASFRLVNTLSDELTPAIDDSRDLGIMLYDMDFKTGDNKPDALFYRAVMNNGVVIVPSKQSEEVMK